MNHLVILIKIRVNILCMRGSNKHAHIFTRTHLHMHTQLNTLGQRDRRTHAMGYSKQNYYVRQRLLLTMTKK